MVGRRFVSTPAKAAHHPSSWHRFGGSSLPEHRFEVWRLQSTQNAAARLIYRIRRYDHITDALISLYWLQVPERISFKIAVLTYRSLNGSAPSYLSYFTRVADVPSRHRLRSASTSRLTTPFIRRSTVGKRSFPVVGADLWNELPADNFCTVAASFQTTAEDFLVSTLLSGHSCLTVVFSFLHMSLFRGPSSNFLLRPR